MSDAIKVGDTLRDNDPRMAHRGPLTVTRVMPNGYVVIDSRGRQFIQLAKRCFTDGKARRYGLNLVERAP